MLQLVHDTGVCARRHERSQAGAELAFAGPVIAWREDRAGPLKVGVSPVPAGEGHADAQGELTDDEAGDHSENDGRDATPTVSCGRTGGSTAISLAAQILSLQR